MYALGAWLVVEQLTPIPVTKERIAKCSAIRLTILNLLDTKSEDAHLMLSAFSKTGIAVIRFEITAQIPQEASFAMRFIEEVKDPDMLFPPRR